MSADSFIRRASGLLVPKMSFAAPWLWIPCVDCDCEEECICVSCSGAVPCFVTVEISGATTEDCATSACSEFNDTFELEKTVVSCHWENRLSPEICFSGSVIDFKVANPYFQVQVATGFGPVLSVFRLAHGGAPVLCSLSSATFPYVFRSFGDHDCDLRSATVKVTM